MKKILTIAVAALAVAAQAGSAEAQGRRPSPTPTPMSAPTPAPWVDPGPTSSSATSSGDSSMMAAATAPAMNDGTVTYRPEGRSFGIGLGWTFSHSGLGTDSADGSIKFSEPNTASARIRMPTGMTIEPVVGLGIGATSSKVDTAKSSGTAVDLFAGANIRKPMMSRNQVDFLGIIGGGLDISSTSSKVGDVKSSETGIGLGATWGIGVEWWPKTHWSLSLDATNPLLNVNSTSGKQGDVKTSSTAFFIGGIFDPTVRAMAHLYY